MTRFEELLSGHTGTGTASAHDRWQRAHVLFGQRRYVEAAAQLEAITEQGEATAAVRLLLARSYFHSAQLGRAIHTARALTEDDPSDGYAQLLLGRALQRAGRGDEARTHLRLAAAMGSDPESDPAH